jgi:flagellar motility protein MotE (MotC chaperone)
VSNPYKDFFKKRAEVKSGTTKSTRFNRVKSKKRHRPPAGLVILATGLAGVCVWYLTTGEEAVQDIWSKVEISVFGEASAASSSEAKPADAKKAEAAKDAAEKGEKTDEVAKKEEPKKNWTTEEIDLFKKLEVRKRELDLREAQLTSLEEELQKQKEQLEKRLAELEATRGKIATKLEEKVKVDQQKVETLIGMYQNMKPGQAAKLIETLDDDLAVEVLTKMKNKSAAEILNAMDTEKARKFSEKFAGYRWPANASTAIKK